MCAKAAATIGGGDPVGTAVGGGRGASRGASTRAPRRYSTRVRPVSRRNTSSSVDRRTSTVAGWRPRCVGGDRGRLAVVGVDRTRSGRRSIRSPSPSSWPSSVSWTPAREAQLDDLARGVALDELARRALGDDPRLVHDHEPVAQLLGLVHVVRGQHQRDAALLEPVEPVPHRCRACGSRPVVGSSRSSRSGSLMSDRAIVRRRFMPPDSGSTWLVGAIRRAGRTRAARRRAWPHSARGRPK